MTVVPLALLAPLVLAAAVSSSVVQGVAAFSLPPAAAPLVPTSSRISSPGRGMLERRFHGPRPIVLSSSQSTESPTSSSSADESSAEIPPSRRYDAAIVGSGPAGLLSAIMLAERRKQFSSTAAAGGSSGGKIAVYDRLSSPPDPTDSSVWSDVARFYLIGLGHRGQAALRRFKVWDQVEAVSVPVVGRKDWTPGASPDEGVERLAADKPTTTMVLPRDKLVGVLHRHILDNYADDIELHYQHQVVPLDFGSDDGSSNRPVRLGVSECTEVAEKSGTMTPEAECDVDNYRIISADLVLGADGAARTIANAMEEADVTRIQQMTNPFRKLYAKRNQFRVKRFVDDNKRVYKTVPVQLPPDGKWRYDLNYSARSVNNRITFEALPSDDRGSYCALLLMREDDEFAQPNADPAKLRQFFDDEFAQFGDLISDDTLATVAAKPASNLPQFRYAGPRLYQGDRTALLGDAIHTVKPYYGLGANTALEDVSVLADALDGSSSEGGGDGSGGEGGAVDGGGASVIRGAVRRFSDRRAGEANALVTISRNMDRPGRLGTAAFIVPIILDGIFHKLAPAIFAPNMFAMFQQEGTTFGEMQRRKRQDRIVQVVLLGSVVGGLVAGFRAVVSAVARAVGKSDGFVGGVLVASAAFLAMLKKAIASSVGKGGEGKVQTG